MAFVQLFEFFSIILHKLFNERYFRLMKKILFAVLMLANMTLCFAQSGTNSPYSQYGFGVLSEQSSGFNRGMNGVGLGFREHNQVNNLNPASYSSIDSLTFIFDAGVSGQITNFSENGKKKNAKNADFEYVVAGLRLAPHVGVSFGVIPFTNVGYSYTNTGFVNNLKTSSFTNSYSGSGGIHEVYLGFGWEPFKGFSFGVNGGYIWGGYNKTLVNNYTESYANTLTKNYMSDVHSYKVDFGLQYSVKLAKNDQLTLGLTYGLGHKIGGNARCQVIMRNSQTSVSDTTNYPKKDGLNLELPHMFGAGFAYNHANKLKFGVDYSLQQWSKVEYPEYYTVNDLPVYALRKDMFKDRHKVTIGGEYCPSATSKKFLKSIRYRAGVSYATPYLKINGADGPKEISASVGFGIPIINIHNTRSILNISGQWVHQNSKSFITENTFRINIGLTFNEKWFAKWKIE